MTEQPAVAQPGFQDVPGMTPDAEGMLPEPDDPPPGFQSSRAVADDPSSQQDMDAAAPAPARSAPQQIYDSDLTFADLDLKPELLDALLLDMKYERPSKIQAKTLPIVLREPDRHMIAQGHNGSGKTTCFILAMLMRVDPEIAKPQAICMCPTRELVIQNLGVLKKMANRASPPITAKATSDFEDSRSRRAPPISEHVIIATPGTLDKWIMQRRLALDSIRVLVFDEADQMLMTEGFQDSSFRMLSFIRKVSPDVQILMFSATFNDTVREYCNRVVPGAKRVYVEKEDLSLDVIKQHKVFVDGVAAKDHVLKSYIFTNADRLGQTIIFVRTRAAAENLYAAMLADGYKCSKLAGDMEKDARDVVVEQFRSMQTRILISTDIISRGFDVNTVTLVVNYDLPVTHGSNDPDYETYLHRIGRSGRFGKKGAAFNFVDRSYRHRGSGKSDEDVMTEIELYFDRPVREVPAEDEDAFIAVLEDAGLMNADD